MNRAFAPPLMRIPPPSASRMVGCFPSLVSAGRAAAVAVRHVLSALFRRFGEPRVSALVPGWLAAVSVLFVIAGSARAAGPLTLEFTGTSADGPLEKQPVIDGGANGKLTLMRLDFLLTGLSLQKTDGTWVDASKDWAAFLSVGKQRLSATAVGIGEGDYQAIRFRI